MDYIKAVTEYLNVGIEARKAIDPKEVVFISDKVYEAIKGGNKLILFGNGGSAADAQHIAEEFMGGFLIKGKKALPAIALPTDGPSMTMLANDYGYEEIFSKYLEAIGKKGDVVIALSTSGNSKNVINGVRKAKSMGMYTIGFTGGSGGALKNEVDKAVIAKAKIHGQMQEVHITIGHLVSMVVEEKIYGQLP